MHGSEHGGGAVTAALLKGGLVAGLGLLLAVLVFQLPPIPQDLAYHVFVGNTFSDCCANIACSDDRDFHLFLQY